MSNTPPPNPAVPPPTSSTSPKWGPTVKLIVGLTFVAIFAALLVSLRGVIGPLLLVFVLIYMIHPVAVWITNRVRISWRATINIIYLLLVIIVIAFFTVTGLAIVQQIQNLVVVVTHFVTDLPQIAQDLSTRIFTFGPFQLELSHFDLPTLSTRLLSYVEPLLGRVGELVSGLATKTAATLGWLVFVLLISYFFLVDASRVPEELIYVEIPGYDADVRRLAFELRRIWNAFLRNQLIMFGLVVVTYTILMTVLGVRYSYAIGIMAGLARFVPYLGPLTTWTVTFLVAYFQGWNYFGLLPWQYTILVLGLAMLTDSIFDNLVSPRLQGKTLGVHPAAVLIAAIVAANLIGIIGLVFAAPVLATLTLLGRYAIRKMLDLNPFPQPEEVVSGAKVYHVPRTWHRLQAWYRALRQRRT